MEKILNFSEPFLSVEHVSYAENYQLQGKAIILNIDLDPLFIDYVELPALKSMICANTTITKATNMIVITLANEDYLGNNPKIDREIITNTWHHVFDIFSVPQLNNTPLWRSEKERIGNLEFNLWYAPAGTDCGIHNKHDFFEVHTQIYGIGRMQKFHVNHLKSLYQEVYMSPGYTHDPFYSQGGKYPWHQYYADSDCIWLAIEQY
jgi:hypothetical protein